MAAPSGTSFAPAQVVSTNNAPVSDDERESLAARPRRAICPRSGRGRGPRRQLDRLRAVCPKSRTWADLLRGYRAWPRNRARYSRIHAAGGDAENAARRVPIGFTGKAPITPWAFSSSGSAVPADHQCRQHQDQDARKPAGGVTITADCHGDHVRAARDQDPETTAPAATAARRLHDHPRSLLMTGIVLLPHLAAGQAPVPRRRLRGGSDPAGRIGRSDSRLHLQSRGPSRPVRDLLRRGVDPGATTANRSLGLPA